MKQIIDDALVLLIQANLFQQAEELLVLNPIKGFLKVNEVDVELAIVPLDIFCNGETTGIEYLRFLSVSNLKCYLKQYCKADSARQQPYKKQT